MQAITVSGDDVYYAGYQNVQSTQTGYYYKSGSRYRLGTTSETIFPKPIAVQGNDVHVVSYVDEGVGYAYANYWKNGVKTPLTDRSESVSDAVGATVSGDDVYIVGSVVDQGSYYAAIWKNGVRTNLPLSTQAFSICIFNNDIYVSGRSYGRALYWKNGEPTFLSDGSTAVYATSIVVKKP